MPPGTPFNSFVLPYRIRVDNFASNTGDNAAALHLLTHTHSDHIVGLSAQSFGSKVICSRDAKEMLLRHEVYAERELHDQNYRAQRIRTFAHLKVDPTPGPDGTVSYSGSRDLLETLPLHTPTKYELSDTESVTITLLDANHCPGAVMFLIEGPQGAILHTGDFRAERWFIDNVIRNPFLQPYLAAPVQNGSSKSINKTLKAIYLDTASVLSRLSVPTKDKATSGLTELMRMFPDTVYFFINSWTWGYEDVLKAISREFGSPIHVDRYKYSVYNHTYDPFLRSILTQDPSCTRFHACERFHRCDYVAVNDESWQSQYNTTSYLGKRVVYVNPVNMGSQSWDLYIMETKNRLSQGEEVNNLLVPLSRHSPLDELREFVALFRPRRVIPNTLDPHLRGFDWAVINRMFADCLHFEPSVVDIPDVELDLTSDGQDVVDEDVYMKNLVGEGAAAVAERWAEKYHLRKKLDILSEYLELDMYDKMARIFGLPRQPVPLLSPKVAVSYPPKRKGKERAIDSEDETDNGWSDDERGKTAHQLFASIAGIEASNEHLWWVSSSPVPSQDETDQGDILEPVLMEQGSIPTPSKANQPGPSVPWTSRLTPRSSPVQLKKRSTAPVLLNVTPIKQRASPTTRSKPSRTPQARTPITAQLPPSSPHIYVSSPSPLVEVKNVTGKGAASPLPIEDSPFSIKLIGISYSSANFIHDNGENDDTLPQIAKSFGKRTVCDSSPQQGTPCRKRNKRHPSSKPSDGAKDYASVSRAEANPSSSRRGQLRKQRLRIAERLVEARPDLINPSYAAKRTKLLARSVGSPSFQLHPHGMSGNDESQTSTSRMVTSEILSFRTVDDGDGGMDWDRSRELAAALRADVLRGRRLMLPALACVESQDN
ncbi:Protein artemis [Termitomyces sp. J132]|nr:Protein artemis [Termitomyces sp. J132]